MMRARNKALALAALLGLALTLASGCYYYDHDDHWRYGRYHHHYERYDYDGDHDRHYSRYDWDRDHHWRWDRDRYSYRQGDPLRNHYND